MDWVIRMLSVVRQTLVFRSEQLSAVFNGNVHRILPRASGEERIETLPRPSQ
jgi:hypothetical protein